MAELGPRRVRGAMAAGSAVARALEALGEGAGRDPGVEAGGSRAHPSPQAGVWRGARPRGRAGASGS